MLISVIVPVYNVEKYLKQCVDSILNQTYKELEIILVDDGSTDNSGKICDEYESKYENIIVIHKKNAGLGMARNTGMENMHGKYVTFIDSDDYIDNTLIENLYNSVINNKVDMCKSGFTRVDEIGREILTKTKYANEVFEGDRAKREMLPRMIGSAPDKKDSIEMAVCAVLYNTEYIVNNNIRFPSERQLISEDLIFNIDYMQYCNGSCTIDITGYNYRYNVASLTKKYREDRFESSTFFFETIKEKCKKIGYNKDTILRASRMYFIYLRMSIQQEIPKISNKKMTQNIRKIKQICNNKVVMETIKDYPINKIGMKQRIFLYLLKYKFAIVIYVLAILKII